MRHLKAGRRLGVTTSHRRAMMRNLVTSILEKGQVTCTLARAKEVRKPLEKMITLAKRGDLHARRKALRFVKSKEAMLQLFGELGERFNERHGGYCRIIKLGQTRLGDNAEMAIIQLIGSEKDQLSSLKTKRTRTKPSRKKSGKVLKEVSKEVQQAEESKKKILPQVEETDQEENTTLLADSGSTEEEIQASKESSDEEDQQEDSGTSPIAAEVSALETSDEGSDSSDEQKSDPATDASHADDAEKEDPKLS